METPPGVRENSASNPPRIAKPKPRSMRSRFILMEGATVFLALLLMIAAFGVSIWGHAHLNAHLVELQLRLEVSTKMHDAFDRALVDFWRAYRTPDPDVLAKVHVDTKQLSDLTQQFNRSSATPEENDEAVWLGHLVQAHLDESNRMLAGTGTPEQKSADEDNLRATEAQITVAFTHTADMEYRRLAQAGAALDAYDRVMRILVLALGLFPIAVMIWFRRAHDRNIWAPLEQLHSMVMEVKRGNLAVHGEIPSTVEFGALTSAFLGMASELREMRDSLEEKVRQRATQLEAANKDLLRAAKLASLGQLVSGVAHEINNPLTSILGFSEVVLSRPILDPAARGQVQTIRTEALRLKRLVSNLSTFSRRPQQNFSRIDLRTVPDDLLQLRAYQLAANNIKVDYNRSENPVWVNADSEQLLQVLLHLVMNAEQAIKSVRESGGIHLSCGLHAGRAWLSVADDGCGMSPEMRERIFDPFFTTKPTGQSAGLGLSISHSIVEQHGGQLAIESTVGKGTTVHIYLPLAAGNGKPAAPSSASAGRPPSTSKPNDPAQSQQSPAPDAAKPEMRILAIDDEPEILNLVTVVLGNMGAEVVTLQDSSQLSSVLSGANFDAVLCDLKMPGQDGLAVLRSLRQKRPDLAQRFLLMTGNLADADKARIDLEGVPILPKPFALGRLREMLAQVMSSAKT